MGTPCSMASCALLMPPCVMKSRAVSSSATCGTYSHTMKLAGGLRSCARSTRWPTASTTGAGQSANGRERRPWNSASSLFRSVFAYDEVGGRLAELRAVDAVAHGEHYGVRPIGEREEAAPVELGLIVVHGAHGDEDGRASGDALHRKLRVVLAPGHRRADEAVRLVEGRAADLELARGEDQVEALAVAQVVDDARAHGAEAAKQAARRFVIFAQREQI